MLNARTHDHGFSIIAVTGTLIIIGLLMVTALHLVQDHRRRASLFADHALALQEAEAALAAAECELALATGTSGPSGCSVPPDAARIAALNPVTLAGFVRGGCGQDEARGLCWPTAGQSVRALARLLDETSTDAVSLIGTTTTGSRQPEHRARYVIEPIPDGQPGQWMHAGEVPSPWLFRITAAGFSSDPKVKVMLQAVYRPRVTQP